MHKYDKYHIKESLKVMSQRNTLWDYMVGGVAMQFAINGKSLREKVAVEQL